MSAARGTLTPRHKRHAADIGERPGRRQCGRARAERATDLIPGCAAPLLDVDLKYTADGLLGGFTPVSAKVKLDPTIVSAGIKFRFD